MQVSAKYYWGFRCNLSINQIKKMSEEQIVNYVKKEMEIFFKSNNLLDLSDGVKELKLHIHDKINIDEFHNENKILYVCSCYIVQV